MKDGDRVIATKETRRAAGELVMALREFYEKSGDRNLPMFDVESFTDSHGELFNVTAELPKRFGVDRRIQLATFIRGWNAHENTLI